MKAIRVHGLIIFLCLNVVEPRWRPLRKPRERYSANVFPSDVDKAQLAQLKVPNSIFCAQMEKQIAGVYVLMPWWYNYCQDLKEQRAKNFRGNEYYKPMYKSILERVQWNRRKKQKPAHETDLKWFRVKI